MGLAGDIRSSEACRMRVRNSKLTGLMLDSGVVVPELVGPHTNPVRQRGAQPVASLTLRIIISPLAKVFGVAARIGMKRINNDEHWATEGGTHINGIENFWRQAKRQLRKFNDVPRSSFDLCLKECEWRFHGGSPRNLLKSLRKLLATDQMSKASPFRNVPFLAADSTVDRRRLHCRLNASREPGRFPRLISKGARLCLMARRTFLAGT
jgi:hypothetical protein